jgi:hypothetical protein
MKPILTSEQPDKAGGVFYFALPPEQKVEEFLKQHPVVTQYLLDAREPLQKAFGKDIDKVSVASATNPEMAEGGFLVCSIQTSLPPARALTCLNRFDESWGLDNSQRAQGMVVFTVTFT